MIPADIAETKESSPNRCGVIYRSKCYIIIKSCYIVIIFSFLFVVKEMTDLLYLFKILISDKKAQKYREFQPYWDKIFLPQAAEIPCIFKCFLYHLIYNANHDSETYFIILRFCLWQNFIFIFHQPCPAYSWFFTPHALWCISMIALTIESPMPLPPYSRVLALSTL